MQISRRKINLSHYRAYITPDNDVSIWTTVTADPVSILTAAERKPIQQNNILLTI